MPRYRVTVYRTIGPLVYHTLTLQNHVYKLPAQVARLTTLCIEFSIKVPTRWVHNNLKLVPGGGVGGGCSDFFLTWVMGHPRD